MGQKEYSMSVPLISTVIGVVLILTIVGVATATKKVADWGALHQIVKQDIVAQELKLQLPYRIDEIKPKVEVIVPDTVEKYNMDELTTLEEKIFDRWGIKQAPVAIAIFTCESGMNQYAVSHTGDLGIAQINWATWKDTVEGMGKTSADLLNDVDFNLDVAYMVWDRADGTEGDDEGSWDAWSAYANDAWLGCLQ